MGLLRRTGLVNRESWVQRPDGMHIPASRTLSAAAQSAGQQQTGRPQACHLLDLSGGQLALLRAGGRGGRAPQFGESALAQRLSCMHAGMVHTQPMLACVPSNLRRLVKMTRRMARFSPMPTASEADSTL